MWSAPIAPSLHLLPSSTTTSLSLFYLALWLLYLTPQRREPLGQTQYQFYLLCLDLARTLTDADHVRHECCQMVDLQTFAMTSRPMLVNGLSSECSFQF